MTCILAKIHDGKVHMIGDKMGSNGFNHQVYGKISKVFKNGDFVIGYTTSFRMGQLLQYYWTPPTKSADDTDDVYIFNRVATSIMKCFKDNDFGHKDGLKWEGGNFILGWNGRLFEVQGEMSLLEYEEFTSVGCGEYHAVAAMETLKQTKQFEKNPEKFLATALSVAANCVVGVSHEYDYVVGDK